jgi:hypothetical protein
MEEVRVMQVIRVVVARGTDMPDDKMRSVEQYWSMDGLILAERDPINERDE